MRRRDVLKMLAGVTEGPELDAFITRTYGRILTLSELVEYWRWFDAGWRANEQRHALARRA